MLMLENVTLPEGLNWVDEFNSSAVAQTAKRTLGGTLVVYHRSKEKGVPITLESLSDMGWAEKSTVDQLKALANVPGAVYSLLIRGEEVRVIFRHHEGVAFQATPVLQGGEQKEGSYFQVKILLMTV